MGESKVNSTRHVYMDVIRIIACVLVILVHVSAIDWSICMATDSQWMVLNVINSLGMSGVPLFFMISGALFLRKESELNVKYIWKKILFILLFYLSCLFFYNIFPFICGRISWERNTIKQNLIGNILYGGGIYHLWFLPKLMVLYALAPILKSGLATKKNCEYFLVLFAIFGLTIPLVLRYDFSAHSYLESIQTRFGLFGLADSMGYFILGHYLHEFSGELSKKKQILAACVAGGMMVFIMVCNYFEGLSKGAPTSNMSTPMSITCFVFVSSLYLLIKGYMTGYRPKKGDIILKYLSSLTLGIYFIHPFLIENILGRLGLEKLVANYAVLTIIRIMIVIVLSGVIAAILKKIPILKKIF